MLMEELIQIISTGSAVISRNKKLNSDYNFIFFAYAAENLIMRNNLPESSMHTHSLHQKFKIVKIHFVKNVIYFLWSIPKCCPLPQIKTVCNIIPFMKLTNGDSCC